MCSILFLALDADRAPVSVGKVGRAVLVVLVRRRRVDTDWYLRSTAHSSKSLVSRLLDLFIKTHQFIFVPDRCNDEWSYELMVARYMPSQ